MKRIHIGVLGVATTVLTFSGLSLSRVVSAQAATITEIASKSALGTFGGTAVGHDGNLWYTEGSANKIGYMTPGGLTQDYGTGITASADLRGITNGPDNNLWFAEANANKIGKITTGGTVTEYGSGITASAGLSSITAGPDGNLWFTESSTTKIGVMNTSGTVLHEYAAGGSSPYDIVAGGDGNLWYTEPNSNTVVKMTTSGVATPYTLPTSSSADIGLAKGPDGNIYVAERDGNKIAKVTPSGTITEYTVPTSNAEPIGIIAGSDGNLWIGEANTSKIAMMTTSGHFSEITTPTGAADPDYLSSGSDGNIWFLEMSGGFNKIGKVTLPTAPTANAQTVAAVSGKSVTVNVLSGATNNPDPATVTIDSEPSHGTASVNQTTGAITYTPTAGYSGTDSLSFIVCSSDDGGVCSADPVLTFNVTATATTPDTGYGAPAKRLKMTAALVTASVLLIGVGIGVRRKYSRS